MLSTKLHILMVTALLGTAVLQSSCVNLFKGRETLSAAKLGGKEVISHRQPDHRAYGVGHKHRVVITNAHKHAPESEKTSSSDQQSKLTPAMEGVESEKMTAATVSVETYTIAPVKEIMPIKPAPQLMVPKKALPTEPLATMPEEIKPIAKMAKTSVPTPPQISIEPEKLGPIVISDDRTNRIVNANGRDVVVRCSNGVIVISGGCNQLTLLGNRNQIQCDSANEVEISGNENTIVVGLLGVGEISGENNDLSWGAGVRSGDPRLEAIGSSNSMKRLE